MGGSKAVDTTVGSLQPGEYGTQGTASPSNIPGSRDSSVTWTDASGNFWLFGGIGVDSTGTQGYVNDLWKYSGGQWTWMSGSNLVNQPGSYGTQGKAAAGNVPGAREGAVGWTDASGNLWLFGGFGYDSTGTACYNINGVVCLLNDLWEYSAGKWTWVGGSNTANQTGSYGTQGTASTNNFPGARLYASGFTDKVGNFWLFGGLSTNSTGAHLSINDLWKYSGGQWTWVSGSNIPNQTGAYGTLGTAAPGNVPGARSSAAIWTDVSGNLWLFGGAGFDSTGTLGDLNDLWKYSGGEWMWMGGSSMGSQLGTYGTLGMAGPGNVPGARFNAAQWTDASGNFWLFGGGIPDQFLNDLWEYQP